jgi:hypothetical protein
MLKGTKLAIFKPKLLNFFGLVSKSPKNAGSDCKRKHNRAESHAWDTLSSKELSSG